MIFFCQQIQVVPAEERIQVKAGDFIGVSYHASYDYSYTVPWRTGETYSDVIRVSQQKFNIGDNTTGSLQTFNAMPSLKAHIEFGEDLP